MVPFCTILNYLVMVLREPESDGWRPRTSSAVCPLFWIFLTLCSCFFIDSLYKSSNWHKAQLWINSEKLRHRLQGRPSYRCPNPKTKPTVFMLTSPKNNGIGRLSLTTFGWVFSQFRNFDTFHDDVWLWGKWQRKSCQRRIITYLHWSVQLQNTL